jgi:hypothetical protein
VKPRDASATEATRTPNCGYVEELLPPLGPAHHHADPATSALAAHKPRRLIRHRGLSAVALCHLRPAGDCQAAQIKLALGGRRAIAGVRDRRRPGPSGPYSAIR